MLIIVIPDQSVSPVMYNCLDFDTNLADRIIKKFNDDLAKYMSDIAQITSPSVFCLCTEAF
jgi:hypothetical protein